jgi:phage shock protein A
MKEQNIMQRLVRFCQGLFGVKMNQTEIGRTDIVYHNAIKDRVKQHHDLKIALSRLIILRNKNEARTQSLQEDLLIVQGALTKAAQSNDENRGVELVEKRNSIQRAVETTGTENIGFEQQITSAKEGLEKLSESIEHLKAEQAKIDARRKHAQARIQAAEALQSQITTNFDDTSLGRVRDAVEELEARAGLVEHSDPEPQKSLSIESLRKEQEQSDAREEFRNIRSQESGRLLAAPNMKSVLGTQVQEVHS